MALDVVGVIPVGDPTDKACKALGLAIPVSDDESTTAVVLFEAGPAPEEGLSSWPGDSWSVSFGPGRAVGPTKGAGS